MNIIRRNKLEIFYDILCGIEKEGLQGKVKPTRVQQQCNMSYDKFLKNIHELIKRNLITKNPSLEITREGRDFLQDYNKIVDFLIKMKLTYLEGDIKNEI